MTPTIAPDDLSRLMVMSVRYAIGRSSYAPQEACRCLAQYRHLLTDTDLVTILKDITRHEGLLDLGDAVNEQAWRDAQSLLKAEQYRRANQP